MSNPTSPISEPKNLIPQIPSSNSLILPRHVHLSEPTYTPDSSHSTCTSRSPNTHLYSLTDLFHQDMASEFNQILTSEISHLTQKIIPRELPTFQPRTSIRNSLKSFLSEFPTNKHNTFKELDTQKINTQFFQKVIFVKIINQYQLIFFGLNDKTVVVFRRDIEKITAFRVPSNTNCMDYDSKNDVFVFGHQEGQISFARWCNNQLLFDRESQVEYYSDAPIKFLHCVSSCDVLVLLNSLSKGQLLIRTSSTKFSYKVFNLLGPVDKSLIYDHISVSRIQKINLDNDISKTLIVITFTCQALVKFIFLEVEYHKQKFNGKFHVRSDLVRVVENPKLQNTDSTDLTSKSSQKDSKNQKSEILSERSFVQSMKQISPKKKCFVVPSFTQWFIECVPSFIIVWEDVIERYALSDDFKLFHTFRTSLATPLISGCFGATELFIGVNVNLKFVLIQIDKIRFFNDQLPLLLPSSGFLTEITIANIEDSFNYLIGTDTASRAICIFNSRSLEYFQTLTLENYIENLKKNSKLLEIIKLLQEIVYYGGVPLNGVLQFNSTYRFPGGQFFGEYAHFESTLKREVSNIIKTVLDWLGQSDFKHLRLYTEICLEMLVNTKNYELLCSDFVQFVVAGSIQNEEVARLFFNKLLELFETTNLLEKLNCDFFFHVFTLAKFPKTKILLENFLFFVFKRYNFKNEANFSTVILLVSMNKMHDLLFFIYLLNPFSQVNQDALFDAIVESHQIATNIEQEKPEKLFEFSENQTLPILPQKYDFQNTQLSQKFLSYFFDIFRENRFRKIVEDNPCQLKRPNIEEVRLCVREWFVTHLSFFLENFLKESCWLLNELFLSDSDSVEIVFINFEGGLEFPTIKSTKKPFVFDKKVIKNLQDKKHFGGTLFYVSVILRYQQIIIESSFFKNMLDNISDLIFSTSASISQPTFDLELFEFAIYKLIIQNKQSFFKTRPFLSGKNMIFEIDFSDFQNPEGYFFELLSLHFENATPSDVNLISDLIFKFKTQIFQKDKECFFRLIAKQPIDFIFKYHEEFMTDAGSHKFILQIIENLDSIQKLNKSQAVIYFKILCFCNSKKVIPFIENDLKLEFSEKLAICQNLNHLRGLAYCYFKINDFQAGQKFYKQILLNEFSNKEFMSQNSKEIINEVISEMVSIYIDETELQKILCDILIFIAANLHEKIKNFKSAKIAGIFNRLFKFDNKSFLKDLKRNDFYNAFISDSLLSTNLLLNYRALADQSTLILDIFKQQTLFLQKKLRTHGKSGKSLHISICMYCSLQNIPVSEQVIYHACGTMAHDVCVPPEKINKCSYCSKKHLSRLISGPKRKSSEA